MRNPARPLAALALAATLLAGCGQEPAAHDPDAPAADPTDQTTDDSPSAPDPTATSSTHVPGPGEVRAVPGYYLGTTPDGVRLYREFRALVSGDDEQGRLDAAIEALTTAPDDPDYRTVWQEGDLVEPRVEGDVVSVRIGGEALRARTDGLSRRAARMSVEQVVRTLQAAVGRRAPVQFRLGDNPVDQVLGVPTSEPLAQGPDLEVLSLVNLTDPAEGAEVRDGELAVRGVANSFEATVTWELRARGTDVVAEGFFTAEGWMDERLFPFEGIVAVADLDAGDYLLVVRTDDPSGGTEGHGPFEDSRLVHVAG